MASNIYSFAYDTSFKNKGVEKKYIQQTKVYFRVSLKILKVFIPIFLAFDGFSIIPVLISGGFFFVKSMLSLRILIFLMTTFHTNSVFVALLADWISHIYTIRCSSCYLALSIAKLSYWKYSGRECGLDLVASVLLLFYLTSSIQVNYRKLWAEMETNKRKMMQERTILNEIQSGVIIFDTSGMALTANHKAMVFLQTRGIADLEKLKYNLIFPESCQERIKSLFSQGLQGTQIEEEFLLSHEHDSIPPLFSAVLISFKSVEYNRSHLMHMTVIDIGNVIMRRRFLASNQRSIEETSLIIEEEFINLYVKKQPLKNRHMRSLNHYLLSQRDLLVLMDNYLGESEVINEFFEIKNEVVNTVHICWRGAKVKRMNIVLICEPVIPKQVFGDSTKHSQMLKSILEFAILTGELNTEILLAVSLRKFTKSVSIEYKLSFYTKSLSVKDLDFIFRIRKDSEQPKLLEEMIEISEKYGLGIAIFDVLLTITGGYVLQVDLQDKIYRVVISYVLRFESAKETENPLRGVCLYNKLSDGVSFRWGKREKTSESQPLSVLHKFSDVFYGVPSGSLDFIIPEEPPENFEELASIESRSLIQRDFVTSQHNFSSPCFDHHEDA